MSYPTFLCNGDPKWIESFSCSIKNYHIREVESVQQAHIIKQASVEEEEFEPWALRS